MNDFGSKLMPFELKISSRRSIHANCTVPCYCKMVRYGLEKGGDERQSSNRNRDLPNRSYDPPQQNFYDEDLRMRRRHSEGIDEVDNIASIKLSSSLPATFPFRPHYSYRDDLNFTSSDSSFHQNDQLSSEEINSSETEEIVENSPIYRKISRSRLGSVQRNYAVEHVNKSNDKSYGTTISILLLISICGISYYYNIFNYNDLFNSKSVYDEDQFIKDLNDLAQTYPIKDDELLKLKSGILTISQREDAGSFIFVYDSSSLKFNRNQFDNFVENVARLSVRFLRNDTSETTPVIPTSSDLLLPEPSALISLHRAGLIQKGVMLVYALSRIPAPQAQAFHYYCDEYNPLVKKSAVFFTLDVADCPNDQDKLTQHGFVEKCLTKAWHSVPLDNLGPLLTRVVNIIIDLQH